MRLVFLLVLAVNAAYLGWQLRHLEPASHRIPRVIVPDTDHVNRLLLLSEVDETELRERRLQPTSPTPDTMLAAVAPNAPVIVGEFALDLVPIPAPVVAPDPNTGRLCYSAGPLLDDNEVDTMRNWLADQGAAVILRAGERREIALYWVLFPPFPDRTQADQRLAQMKAEGLEDIYIIPRGDMANAVSLGVYSQRASLDRRLRQLRRRGYEPSITPRYRTKVASWFDVEFPPDFNFDYPTFAATFPAVEMAPATCPATSMLTGIAPETGEAPKDVPAGTSFGGETTETPPAAVAGMPERRYFYSTDDADDPPTTRRPGPFSRE